MNPNLAQYIKDSGLPAPFGNDESENRAVTPVPLDEDYLDLEMEEDEDHHHDRFKSERADGNVVTFNNHANVDQNKLNCGLDDLIKTGQVEIPPNIVERKNNRDKGTKDFRPKLNRQGNQFKCDRNRKINHVNRQNRQASPWANGFFPVQQMNNFGMFEKPMQPNFNLRPTPSLFDLKPGVQQFQPGFQQFQPPLPAASSIKSRLYDTKPSIYNRLYHAAPKAVVPCTRVGELLAPSSSNNSRLRRDISLLLEQLNLPAKAIQNCYATNPNGIQDYVVQVGQNLFRPKYDMKIQKEIAKIQGKSIAVVNGVESPVTSDGTVGVDSLNGLMISTEKTLNFRFAFL